MHTETRVSEPVALFFFAHQDDEFGVFQAILDERRQGRRVICCYLTDGGFGGVSVTRRNNESLAVLGKLGVVGDDVLFAGEALSIADGRLPENMEQAGAWIDAWLARFDSIQAIYVTAWEGGHHDHDALHAIVATVAQRRGHLAQCRQFALYNAFHCPGPLFRVHSPLAENGAVAYTAVPFADRLRFLRLCLSYPSQAKTWTGLFPFVVIHYLTDGRQATQGMDLRRLSQRPHDGLLYYEKRQFYQWEKMRASVQSWQAKFGGLA